MIMTENNFTNLILIIIITIIAFIAFPLIWTGLYWLGGKLVETLIGNYLVMLLAEFGIVIEATQIPHIAIILGWIGWFFNGGFGHGATETIHTIAHQDD